MTFVFKSAFPIALLLLVLGTVASRDVGAAGDSIIQRCEADDGNAVYTDKPCAQFQARPARLSDDLTIRLAMAEAAGAAAAPALSLGPYRDASEPLHSPTPGRRSPTSGCAQSPQQLSRDLIGAFALHNVNRVAESYHWVGMNQRQALPVMKQLERLSARPLADARYLGAWIASGEAAATEAAATPADSGLMQLVFADGPRIVDFSVRRYSGCYFITS